MFKDNNDPVLFDSALFETANMTVTHCREVMERTGMTQEAKRLSGLEVTDEQTAAIALHVLNGMKAKAEAEFSRQLAVSNLRLSLTA